MVVRDYELLTLHEVRVPSTAAYICLPNYHYTAAERVFRISWQHRADSLGRRDARTMASLSNWITTLIKLKKYEEATKTCRAALSTLKDPDESPYYIIMKCNLAACLVLSKQKEEASKVLDYLRQRHMLVRFDIAAEAYFEALSMTCRTGRDCMVLRESDDRVPGMVRVYNYTTQGNDRNAAESERKPLLDPSNLPSRSENIFSTRLSKTINSHTVQHCLHSLRRTASLLWRPSQVNRPASTTVSLETDVPQEVDARLDSFIASTSPAVPCNRAAGCRKFQHNRTPRHPGTTDSSSHSDATSGSASPRIPSSSRLHQAVIGSKTPRITSISGCSKLPGDRDECAWSSSWPHSRTNGSNAETPSWCSDVCSDAQAARQTTCV